MLAKEDVQHDLPGRELPDESRVRTRRVQKIILHIQPTKRSK
jgi:hypothetical protein